MRGSESRRSVGLFPVGSVSNKEFQFFIPGFIFLPFSIVTTGGLFEPDHVGHKTAGLLKIVGWKGSHVRQKCFTNP